MQVVSTRTPSADLDLSQRPEPFGVAGGSKESAMRFVAVVVVAVVCAAPADAQGPDLAGKEALLCADAVLEWLTEQPQEPYIPTFHLGLARYFLGCTYPPLPPSIGPILDTMRADIEAIHRHQEALAEAAADVGKLHREAVCYSWWAIYSSTYQWLLYEYGSGVLAGLPEPTAHATECERWVE